MNIGAFVPAYIASMAYWQLLFLIITVSGSVLIPCQAATYTMLVNGQVIIGANGVLGGLDSRSQVQVACRFQPGLDDPDMYKIDTSNKSEYLLNSNVQTSFTSSYLQRTYTLSNADKQGTATYRCIDKNKAGCPDYSQVTISFTTRTLSPGPAFSRDSPPGGSNDQPSVNLSSNPTTASSTTPSHPVVIVMYVIGILAYALGYILMGLTECHREHIFGRKSTAACLTCLPCLGILTITILVLWFFTESFTGENDNLGRGFHYLYAALAMSLVYMICSGSYLILVCHEQQCKSSPSESTSSRGNNNTTDNPYIDDTRNSMSIEFKDNTPLLNGSPEAQCEPSVPPPQYDTLARHNPRHQLEESAPPSYERAVNLRY